MLLTAVRVLEVLEEPEAIGQPREDGELPVEGILAEEQVEHGVVLDAVGLPVGVRHRYLVEVCFFLILRSIRFQDNHVTQSYLKNIVRR